jgi:hypothetical protein
VLATIVAAVRALIRTLPIEVEVDGCYERQVAGAVLVTNNVFEGSPWRRPRLDEGMLEVHLLAAPGFVARTRAALAVMTGESSRPILRSPKRPAKSCPTAGPSASERHWGGPEPGSSRRRSDLVPCLGLERVTEAG